MTIQTTRVSKPTEPHRTRLDPGVDPSRIASDIGAWLDEMAFGLPPGRFRFCKQGGLVPVRGQQGQMTTCFAMKSAWQCGVWDGWSEKRRSECIDFVKAFQTENGEFVDPWLRASCRLGWKDFARAVLGRRSLPDALQMHRENDAANIRAETRQSASTLWMVGHLPDRSLPLEVRDRESFRRYVEQFDWSHPWHAGSHMSHQLMMLALNHQLGNSDANYEEVVNAVQEFLDGFEDQETGTWFRGDAVDPQIKLNGAMKIHSGLAWLDGVARPSKERIDFALSLPIQFDGCGFTNSLFVLYYARVGLGDYRKDDIIERSIQCLNQSMAHKQAGGGYSFLKNSAQRFYYSQYVSRGELQADMHGTGMFTLGVALALALIGDHAPPGSESWKPLRG